MTPTIRGGNFEVKSLKLINFLNIVFSTPGGSYTQTYKYAVMMTKEGYTRIVIFMIPGEGVVILGRVYIIHSKYALSSILSIYIWMIPIVWKDYNAAFLCWFLLILRLGCWTCKYESFWPEISVESLILRWPLHCKAPWPIVRIKLHDVLTVSEKLFYTKQHQNRAIRAWLTINSTLFDIPHLS